MRLLIFQLVMNHTPIGKTCPALDFGAQAGLASSYDRIGDNNDWSYYEWPEGQIKYERVCTVKTIQGPIVIYRFWMPHYEPLEYFWRPRPCHC